MSSTERTRELVIQQISDIHLELYDTAPDSGHPNAAQRYPEPCEDADVLVLAGDIGKLSHGLQVSFLRQCAERWPDVIVIAGNHEFQHSRKPIDTLRQLQRERLDAPDIPPNVHWLDGDTITIKDTVFYGTTLFPVVNTLTAPPVNCFSQIKERRMTPHGPRTESISLETQNSIAAGERRWLLEVLRGHPEGMRAVVVTHYPATMDLRVSPPQYHAQPPELRQQFASDLVDELATVAPPGTTCIAGHTHHVQDFEERGLRFVSYAPGQPDEIFIEGRDYFGIQTL